VKHHSEVPLNNEYVFLKMQARNVKQVLFGGRYQQWGEEGEPRE
jgi:hypothetical protein